MTAKKDFKRRVRARQERTGEAYTTARRHVAAERGLATSPEPPPLAGRRIPVIDLVDATELAASLGVRCRVAVFPALAARVAPDRLMVELRNVLDATSGDPSFELLRAVVLRGERPRSASKTGRLEDATAFMRRARAGIGGVSKSGRALALTIDGQRVLYRLSLTPAFAGIARDPAVVVRHLDALDGELPTELRELLDLLP